MNATFHELTKNTKFLTRNIDDIISDDVWTISEAISFYAMFLQKTPFDHYDSDYEEMFRFLYNLIVSGIEHNEIKLYNHISKNKNPFLTSLETIILDMPSLAVESCGHINIYPLSINRNFKKIKLSLLKKCIKSLDVIEFFRKYEIYLEKAPEHRPTILELQSIVDLHLQKEPKNLNKMTCPAEQPKCKAESKTQRDERMHSFASDSENITHGHEIQKLKTEIARENAEKNGENWRLFVSNKIKPAVEHELLLECLCLHRDMAARLNGKLSTEAKKCLKPKDYKKTDENLSKKIEKAIKKVFYEFDENHKKVRSRVYRGEYYHEYDHVPCGIHSGK